MMIVVYSNPMIKLVVTPLIIAFSIGSLVSQQPVEYLNSKVITIITNPSPGDLVSDTVQIVGTVGNAEFDHYAIHFALYPNPTDTWFPIVLSGTIPVTHGVLGQWDINGISNGRYMIRLEVFDDRGNLLNKAGVSDILVNIEPTATSPIAAPTAIDTKTPPLRPTETTKKDHVVNSEKSLLTDMLFKQQQEYDYISTFTKGAAYSVFIFLTLGFYLQIRKFLRPHLRRILRNIKNDLRRP